jgi:hypothetical protein
MHLLFIWRGKYSGFEACNIYYEGHWKGWALEIETFLGPEMATSEASVIWVQKSRHIIQYFPSKTVKHEDPSHFC